MKLHSAPLVYLDSRDLSTLADRKSDPIQRATQIDALIDLAASEKVKFVYSAIHISEAAPVSENATGLAVDRAKILGTIYLTSQYTHGAYAPCFVFEST